MTRRAIPTNIENPQADAHARQLWDDMQKLAASDGIPLYGELTHVMYRDDDDEERAPMRYGVSIEVKHNGHREQIVVDASGQFSCGDNPVILKFHHVSDKTAAEDAFHHVTEQHIWPTGRSQLQVP